MSRLAQIIILVTGAMLAGVALAIALSGSPADKTVPAAPPPEAQLSLVQESMRSFVESVGRKDMTAFHSHISDLWKGQASVEDLNTVFGPLIASNIDLGFVNGMTPEITAPPVVTGNGVLEIVGIYPSQPSRLTFEHSYVYEDGVWKMSGIRLGDDS